jgi:hypothetical protein
MILWRLFFFPEQVDLRLHQEAADLEQMGKLLQIQMLYLLSVSARADTPELA